MPIGLYLQLRPAVVCTSLFRPISPGFYELCVALASQILNFYSGSFNLGWALPGGQYSGPTWLLLYWARAKYEDRAAVRARAKRADRHGR